ncbi:MAG: RNA methyltransferase [Rhodospirillaceae bacterium]|nr:RNA methyltransferase [Rhodospirillaceae bacterium]
MKQPTRPGRPTGDALRGYFGIGVEGVSKPFNVGNLFRSAHAFGASFVFTVAADYSRKQGRAADTSKALASQPFYAFPSVEALVLPKGCALVGVELLDDAVVLPTFHHPRQAAYVLGPERGSLSAAMRQRCDHVIKIPTRFSLNVGIAGVVVMYDRLISRGRFGERPLMPGGPRGDAPAPRPRGLDALGAFRTDPPLAEVALADGDDEPA